VAVAVATLLVVRASVSVCRHAVVHRLLYAQTTFCVCARAPALAQVVAAAVAVAVAVVVVVVGVVLAAVAVAAARAMASPSPRCASSAAGSAGQRLLHHTIATLYCANRTAQQRCAVQC
jgi:type IV secretory pathway TrbD component